MMLAPIRRISFLLSDWDRAPVRRLATLESCHAALVAPRCHALEEGDRSFAISAVLSTGGVGLTFVVVIAGRALGLKGFADTREANDFLNPCVFSGLARLNGCNILIEAAPDDVLHLVR